MRPIIKKKLLNKNEARWMRMRSKKSSQKMTKIAALNLPSRHATKLGDFGAILANVLFVKAAVATFWETIGAKIGLLFVSTSGHTATNSRCLS